MAGAAPAERDADVLVVGAGAAGLCAALRAAPRRVLLLCPIEPAVGSSSALAQGGIAAPVGAGDSVELHVRDTLAAAGHAADPQAAARVIGSAAQAIAFLEQSGVAFDRHRDGRSLHREAGHCRARIVHADGDRSGAAIVAALWRQVRACAHVEVLCGWRAVRLQRPTGRAVAGLWAVDDRGGRLFIRAGETVLATGGVGRMFQFTTNGASATGDGLAMALAIGARTAALEFVQFHPTALKVPADPLPLLTEALRGAGARLVTASGRRVMAGRHALGDLAPRDVVARAVWEAAAQGEDVLLDATAVFSSAAAREFPGARETALRHGLDPAVAALPVTAAAHYHMGGVVVDEHGRTSVPGLWACGEVAYTGLHGANRLASNSLLEAVVCGCAVGGALSRSRAARRARSACSADPPAADAGLEACAALRARLWQSLGPVRDGATLRAALADSVHERAALGAEDAVPRYRYGLAIAMLESALNREESRGAHWRRDFPSRDRGRDGPSAVLAQLEPGRRRRRSAAPPDAANGRVGAAALPSAASRHGPARLRTP